MAWRDHDRQHWQSFVCVNTEDYPESYPGKIYISFSENWSVQGNSSMKKDKWKSFWISVTNTAVVSTITGKESHQVTQQVAP